MNGFLVRIVVVVVLATLVVPAETLAGGSLVDRRIAEFTLNEFKGAKRSLSEWHDSPILVVVFLGTECPLARLYGKRLAELEQEYQSRGVQILGINSNQQDTLQKIATYALKHDIQFPLLKDPGGRVADLFGATRTPEAFVLDQNRVVRYHGRIDDQYGIGAARNQATNTELVDALEALLAGKEIRVAETTPVGCLIGRRAPSRSDGEVTYANQISRLLETHCISCHRAGQIAPFTLTDYEDVAAWSDMMLEVIEDRRMPPWQASPDHGKFSNEARLSDEEIELFRTWIADGVPEGDPSQLPTPREYVDGWQIEKYDMVVSMPEPFEVPATGTVPYQYFEVDPGFTEDMWIRGAEARPGNKEVVHHILVFYLPPGQESRRPQDPLFNVVAAFAPGMPPVDHQEEYAVKVPAGSKLVFQVHYTPNGSPQTDLSEAALRFSDPANVKRQIRTIAGLNARFLIPPGISDYRVDAQRKISTDLMLYTLTPHMHYRGKAFRFTAKYPDGEEEILLDVPRYDFNWQIVYILEKPKLLPAGTVIEMEARYDNSADNPLNPDPKQTVMWGDQTWDEMMLGTMMVSRVDEKTFDRPRSN